MRLVLLEGFSFCVVGSTAILNVHDLIMVEPRQLLARVLAVLESRTISLGTLRSNSVYCLYNKQKRFRRQHVPRRGSRFHSKTTTSQSSRQ